MSKVILFQHVISIKKSLVRRKGFSSLFEVHNVFYTYNTPQFGPDASEVFTILLTVLDSKHS